LAVVVNFVLLIVKLQLERAPPFLTPIIKENSRAMFVAVHHTVLAMINHI
jgi:hypothetical protein